MLAFVLTILGVGAAAVIIGVALAAIIVLILAVLGNLSIEPYHSSGWDRSR